MRFALKALPNMQHHALQAVFLPSMSSNHSKRVKNARAAKVKTPFGSDSGSFSQLFREYEKTFEQVPAPRFEKAFREFDAAFKESRTQRVGSTPHLNLLRVFGLSTDELRHSRVLSWFLDADAEHEQGALFAQAFLRLVAGDQAPEIMENQHYLVKRERHGRTDVSVYARERFAVFIENKVHASERADQVTDMIKALVRLADAQQIPVSCRFGVFLTDDGRQPTTHPSGKIPGFNPSNLKPVSRTEVFGVFYQALTHRTASPLLINLLFCYGNAVDQLRTP
jgi:hypothetical protein